MQQLRRSTRTGQARHAPHQPPVYQGLVLVIFRAAALEEEVGASSGGQSEDGYGGGSAQAHAIRLASQLQSLLGRAARALLARIARIRYGGRVAHIYSITVCLYLKYMFKITNTSS